eukprot:CAMPEP_0182421446 /NCGR_PEP_ID=MMETSP1167-20130531/6860_1 /TAXON_ID=2988 /ORGANISM="Mallomonas Sp, Strain CCMP3275" /LENGTH=234 /DNA_ID=CAMNT_0024598617 /DNA_START=142 /DNA_END=846 /DNA_ORIENTATION=+
MDFALEELPLPVITVIITAIIGVIIVVLIIRGNSGKKGTKSRDTVLLLGPCGGGKTLMAHRLCIGEVPDTITSMKPATLQYSAEGGGKTLPVIDFPGHPRLRSQLSDTLRRAKKIVFVVDASNVQSQVREAAEYLYDIFTNPIMDDGPPMLIACNKSDISGVRPPARVKLALQQELEKIRKTRQSMEVVGDTETIPIGREGKEFNIERDSPVEVTFSATSGKAGSIDAIYNFLN